MKKAIVIVLIVGMVSWAVYEFISSSVDTADEEKAADETSNDETNESSSSDTNGSQTGPADDIGLSEGEKAPDFELTTLEGGTVHLSDFEGQRVIVNFWATWCPPCREEIPHLQKLYDNKDVEILAVNMTNSEESEEAVRDFVDDYDMRFPKPLDKNGDIAETYEVRAYPTSYMIDSDGRIQFMAMGAMSYDMMTEELAKVE